MDSQDHVNVINLRGMTNTEREKIIRSWCGKFFMYTHGNTVLVTMRVHGFYYPVAAYLTIEDALKESYERAYAHAWSAVKNVESSRHYGFWP